MQQQDGYQQQYNFIDYTQEQIEQIDQKIKQEITKQINNNNNDHDWKEVLEFMKTQVIQLLNEKPKITFIMNEQKSMELTRLQAFTYLSLMFFELTQAQEDSNLQHNFNFLFDMGHLKNQQNRLAREKLKCIKCYLKLIYQQSNLREQNIKITKLKLNKQDGFQWDKSQSPIAQVELNNGSIFEFQTKNIVNFADPFIGGLTLDGMNCAQEEIIMCLHPEAIISQLFFSKMEDDEAIYFENVLRTCNFTGYEQTFKCIPIEQDPRSRSENIIAIDAYWFAGDDQFEEKWIKRELNKALAGFQVSNESDRDVVSGKWGCGIFRGNIMLKMLIQIAAFSEAVSQNQAAEKPKLILSFFNDANFANYQTKIEKISKDYKSVGELILFLMSTAIQEYCKQ